MNLVFIGTYVNTHGLKGEIKIISDFEYKEDVFKKGNILYINDNKYIINSCRKHNNYDLITFEGVDNINDIENLKGSKIYINKNDYNFEYVYEDLIGMSIYDNGIYRGEVIDILKNKLYPILKIKYNKNYMIPYIDQFIDNVDIENKIINIKCMKGLYED